MPGILTVDDYTDLGGNADARQRVLLERGEFSSDDINGPNDQAEIPLPVTGSYDHLEVSIKRFAHTGTNRQIWGRFTDDNFVTTEAGATDYEWWFEGSWVATSLSTQDASDSQFRFYNGDATSGDGDRSDIDLQIRLLDHANALVPTKIRFRLVSHEINAANPGKRLWLDGGGIFNPASQVNGLALGWEFASNVFDPARYAVWGINS